MSRGKRTTCQLTCTDVVRRSLILPATERCVSGRRALCLFATLVDIDEDRHTAPGVRGLGSVPPSHSGNVITRIGFNVLEGICQICTVDTDEHPMVQNITKYFHDQYILGSSTVLAMDGNLFPLGIARTFEGLSYQSKPGQSRISIWRGRTIFQNSMRFFLSKRSSSSKKVCKVVTYYPTENCFIESHPLGNLSIVSC